MGWSDARKSFIVTGHARSAWAAPSQTSGITVMSTPSQSVHIEPTLVLIGVLSYPLDQIAGLSVGAWVSGNVAQTDGNDGGVTPSLNPSTPSEIIFMCSSCVQTPCYVWSI